MMRLTEVRLGRSHVEVELGEQRPVVTRLLKWKNKIFPVVEITLHLSTYTFPKLSSFQSPVVITNSQVI